MTFSLLEYVQDLEIGTFYLKLLEKVINQNTLSLHERERLNSRKSILKSLQHLIMSRKTHAVAKT